MVITMADKPEWKDSQQVFGQLDEHLLQDEQPSLYLEEMARTPVWTQPPFAVLARLQATEQSPQHHPEGNVWNHTLLVVDEAAKVRDKSENARVFMWAALLHDIGKPDTTRLRKGRLTSYDHDKRGAELVDPFLEACGETPTFIRQVRALVRWHMQILFVVKSLPFADVQGMKADTSVREVALLGLCDRLGRAGMEPARCEQEKAAIRRFVILCGESEAVADSVV